MTNNDIEFNFEEMEQKFGEEMYSADFYFCKCPNCKKIYLYEYDQESFFINPNNFQEVVSDSNFKCLECEFEFTSNDKVTNGIWFGSKQDPKFFVTKQEILASDWKWAII